jgi:hypothetical protein
MLLSPPPQDAPSLASSAVFNRVLLFMLKEADGIFRRMLGVEAKPDIGAQELLRSSRWRKMQVGGVWEECVYYSYYFILILLHGLLDGPRAVPMATDKLGSFKNIL